MKSSQTTNRSKFLSVLTAGMIALCSTSSAWAAPKIPEIDRSKPVDLNRYQGGERPDDQEVLDAFSSQLDALAGCVNAAKSRSNMGDDDRLEGGAVMTILLNPEGKRPLAVSAEVPQTAKKLKQFKRFRQCLRIATWKGDYPAYDGPPIEVDFEFELDPGYDWVEE